MNPHAREPDGGRDRWDAFLARACLGPSDGSCRRWGTASARVQTRSDEAGVACTDRAGEITGRQSWPTALRGASPGSALQIGMISKRDRGRFVPSCNIAQGTEPGPTGSSLFSVTGHSHSRRPRLGRPSTLHDRGLPRGAVWLGRRSSPVAPDIFVGKCAATMQIIRAHPAQELRHRSRGVLLDSGFRAALVRAFPPPRALDCAPVPSVSL